MRERVIHLAGAAGARVPVSTFHAFGLRFLAEEHAAAGLPKRFAIADAGDQLALVKRAMREVKVDDRSFDPRRVLWQISKAKNALKKKHHPAGRRGRGTTTTSSPPRSSRATSRRCGPSGRSTSTTSSPGRSSCSRRTPALREPGPRPGSATSWWTSTRTPTSASSSS